MPGGKGNSKSRLKKIDDIIQEGKAVSDVWPIPVLSSSSKERVGYPTQKPLVSTGEDHKGEFQPWRCSVGSLLWLCHGLRIGRAVGPEMDRH